MIHQKSQSQTHSCDQRLQAAQALVAFCFWPAQSLILINASEWAKGSPQCPPLPAIVPSHFLCLVPECVPPTPCFPFRSGRCPDSRTHVKLGAHCCGLYPVGCHLNPLFSGCPCRGGMFIHSAWGCDWHGSVTGGLPLSEVKERTVINVLQDLLIAA